MKSKIVDGEVELEWATRTEKDTRGFVVKHRPAKTSEFEELAPFQSKGEEGGILCGIIKVGEQRWGDEFLYEKEIQRHLAKAASTGGSDADGNGIVNNRVLTMLNAVASIHLHEHEMDCALHCYEENWCALCRRMTTTSVMAAMMIWSRHKMGKYQRVIDYLNEALDILTECIGDNNGDVSSDWHR